MSRILTRKDEPLEAVNDCLIVENVGSLQETRQKVVTTHLTLGNSIAAVRDDFEDVSIQSALVLDNIRCQLTKVELDTEENLERR